jgi:GNAT superfamily N-acetyltransferase
LVLIQSETSREFALVVADIWQRKGIGTQLMTALMKAARKHGLKEMEGEILSSNNHMLDLVRGLGFAFKNHPEDASVNIASHMLRGRHSCGIMQTARLEKISPEDGFRARIATTALLTPSRFPLIAHPRIALHVPLLCVPELNVRFCFSDIQTIMLNFLVGSPPVL